MKKKAVLRGLKYCRTPAPLQRGVRRSPSRPVNLPPVKAGGLPRMIIPELFNSFFEIPLDFFEYFSIL